MLFVNITSHFVLLVLLVNANEIRLLLIKSRICLSMSWEILLSMLRCVKCTSVLVLVVTIDGQTLRQEKQLILPHSTIDDMKIQPICINVPSISHLIRKIIVNVVDKLKSLMQHVTIKIPNIIVQQHVIWVLVLLQIIFLLSWLNLSEMRIQKLLHLQSKKLVK